MSQAGVGAVALAGPRRPNSPKVARAWAQVGTVRAGLRNRRGANAALRRAAALFAEEGGSSEETEAVADALAELQSMDADDKLRTEEVTSALSIYALN